MKLIKHLVVTSCACVLAMGLFSCSLMMSEEARAVQRKIDKALESEPTYEDLVEIQNDYDDLLLKEQETIKNYDKIEEQLKVTASDVAIIYSANQFKPKLKNPSSLEIISASVTPVNSEDGGYYVKLDYTATNSFGAALEDIVYWQVEQPVYDESTDQWSCKTNDDFAEWMEIDEEYESLTGIESNDCQEMTQIHYENSEYGEIDANVEKIKNNLDMSISDLN